MISKSIRTHTNTSSAPHYLMVNQHPRPDWSAITTSEPALVSYQANGANRWMVRGVRTRYRWGSAWFNSVYGMYCTERSMVNSVVFITPSL